MRLANTSYSPGFFFYSFSAKPFYHISDFFATQQHFSWKETIKFGVPYFDVFDFKYTEFGIPTAVRGTISFKITDYKEFIKLHRLIDFNIDNFKNEVRDAVCKYVKEEVTSVPSKYKIPVIQIETKIGDISDNIEKKVSERLLKDFGVTVTGLDIDAVEIDKTSNAYNQLISITRGVTSATIKAETEANIRNIAEKQKTDMENYAENQRIQREESRYAIHKKTQSENMDAYQIEAQKDIAVAGAEALGKMGENNATNISMGNDGTGFNPTAMMVGMTLGGAVGQNIAGVMNSTISNNTPPALPDTYYVLIDEQQEGPYNIDKIKDLINNNKINKDTYLWKSGMPEWEKAKNIDSFKFLFPPDIPKKDNT